MLKTAIRASKLAGKIVEKNFFKEKKINTKEGKELVTNIDLASEKLIIDIIQEKFPRHNLWSEECGSLKKTDSGYEWFIDPIDGTNNYINTLPFVGVSIGLMYNKKPRLGVVYFPMLNQLFYAEKGKGAFLNGKKISCSSVSSMGKSVVFFDSNFKSFSPNISRVFNELVNKSFRLRVIGAATINLCYIANGSANICVDVNLKPGDITASAIIIEEAGGLVTDHEGNPWHPECKDILATNKKLHEKILAILKKR
jgi:myo-inositol-1(or 4)-monophosphatase